MASNTTDVIYYEKMYSMPCWDAILVIGASIESMTTITIAIMSLVATICSTIAVFRHTVSILNLPNPRKAMPPKPPQSGSMSFQWTSRSLPRTCHPTVKPNKGFESTSSKPDLMRLMRLFTNPAVHYVVHHSVDNDGAKNADVMAQSTTSGDFENLKPGLPSVQRPRCVNRDFAAVIKPGIVRVAPSAQDVS
jgi:hypothetical protein